MTPNDFSPPRDISSATSITNTEPTALHADLPAGPDNPPWGVATAFLTWIASVGCLLFVPPIVLIPYVVYVGLASGHLPTGDLLANKAVVVLSILGVIPAHYLTFAIVWLVVVNWGRYPFWKTIGFSWPTSITRLTTVGLSIAVAVLLLGIGALVTSLYGGQKTQLDQLIESSYQARIATAFLAVATGPLIEELVYRGILYPAIARLFGMTWAIIVVSVMFAGVHVLQYINNLAVIAVIALLSVALTLIRARTGRVLPTFLVHLVFNGLQSVFLILQPFFEKADKTPKAAPALTWLVKTLLHLI